LPVTHAIALDPWIDPLPSPGPAPYTPESSMPSEESSQVPELMVINSEGFTLWDEHYNRLAGVVRSWNDISHSGPQAAEPSSPAVEESSQGKVSGLRATLMTLVRAQHISFSDFGVLLPFGRYAREGRRFLSVTEELILAFLGGRHQFEEVLGKQKQVEGKVEEFNTHKPDSATEWKKRIVGEVGDIVVH
jgi:platelet-activating factor acetylhydrolase